MRKKILKMLSATLCLSMILSNLVSASVKNTVSIGQYEGKVVSLEEVKKEFKDFDINKIPSFDSIEEAEEYIAKFNVEINSAVENINTSNETNSVITFESLSSDNNRAINSGILTQKNGGPAPGTDFNCEISFRYTTNPNRFYTVDSVNSFLSDFTMWTGWVQTSAIGNITPSKQSVEAITSGLLKTYLLINSSLTEISSQPQTITTYFACEWI